MHTEDLDEYVEDLENVVAWDYNEQSGVVTVFVTERVPEDELADDDLVANALEHLDAEIEVVAVGGEFRIELVDDRYDAHAGLQDVPEERHRPVPDGVSEINAKSTAATAGYYKAKVVDPKRAIWSPDVEYGDVVRLSNNHVYARSNKANLGEYIIQPSPRDGGTNDDIVGQLVGYVRISDGVRVDIAARTASDDDTDDKHDLDERFGSEIVREDYEELVGSEITKTGRTTGVTTGRILGTSTTVNVRYPDGTVRLRDCIIATAMSQGGDSGSDVFVDETGAYVGALFAGSPTSTIICKAVNIEEALGVHLEAHDRGTDVPPGIIDRLIRLLIRWWPF